MAYRVTGDPLYLRTIINGYDFLQRTQCYATGGYGAAEQLRAPDGSLGSALERRRDTFETPCGSWAGFKLSRYLIGFTGEARYGDWVERLVYNGIGAALPMKGSGSTFYYSDYQLFGCTKVYHEEDYRGETWPCCAGTYPEAVADYHNLIYFKNKTALFVNLFVPSEGYVAASGPERSGAPGDLISGRARGHSHRDAGEGCGIPLIFPCARLGDAGNSGHDQRPDAGRDNTSGNLGQGRALLETRRPDEARDSA